VEEVLKQMRAVDIIEGLVLEGELLGAAMPLNRRAVNIAAAILDVLIERQFNLNRGRHDRRTTTADVQSIPDAILRRELKILASF
jgi:hypothetical protein